MKLAIDLDSGIDDLIESFADSPEKVAKAIDRSLRKLSRFAESRTLREVSRQMKVTTKLLKKLGRVKANLYKPGGLNPDGYRLVVWIGVFDIPAHYLGKPAQTKAGVRTGKHFWDGAFLFQPVNAPHDMVFKRAPHWKHKQQVSRQSGRLMWMGLPIEKQSLSVFREANQALAKLEPLLLERFATLLQQELNFAFNIE